MPRELRNIQELFMLLDNKAAIVTGGNSGIGKAIVLALARQGASIAVDYVSHEDATDELEKEVRAFGDKVPGNETQFLDSCLACPPRLST
jgi:NAD(P)-dependent dehydrogenase (short-subunit alcohol dehydrogenase family)